MDQSGNGAGLGRGGDAGTDDPQRTLADRLAKGEIDIDEYERRLEALRRAEGSHTRN